jgi:malate dehydrogenase
MTKISFIGSGGVSCTTAFACGLKLGDELSEIVLIDVNYDIAFGRGADLRQGFILNGTDTKVTPTNDYSNITGSDVIVITASIPAPANVGIHEVREAMLKDNKKIIAEIADKLKKVIPTDDKQPLIIVVSNPLDLILNHFIKIGNFNKKKTIGSGNWLDTSRLIDNLTREEIKAPPSKIKTMTVAQHGAKMLYLLSQTTVDGKPLSSYNIDPDKLKKIVENSINGAGEITSKGQTRTLYGVALSIFSLIYPYLKDTKQLVCCSTYCNGEYGVKDYTMGVPVILGKNGVEKIVVLDLTEEEKQAYRESYNFVLETDAEGKK